MKGDVVILRFLCILTSNKTILPNVFSPRLQLRKKVAPPKKSEPEPCQIRPDITAKNKEIKDSDIHTQL
jgi:hypothetical protein